MLPWEGGSPGFLSLLPELFRHFTLETWKFKEAAIALEAGLGTENLLPEDSLQAPKDAAEAAPELSQQPPSNALENEISRVAIGVTSPVHFQVWSMQVAACGLGIFQDLPIRACCCHSIVMSLKHLPIVLVPLSRTKGLQ